MNGVTCAYPESRQVNNHSLFARQYKGVVQQVRVVFLVPEAELEVAELTRQSLTYKGNR